ncbi:toll/interleukin-1 receptor domain-containing protein [Streptomyces sp. NPDC060064]|uniref:toll/interleukin-1 receptor domain-containing protein n=1 Tax=Streptomyces sp. NPDC060064 TaxID=3347049 RepID=UPI0036BB7E13
MLHHVFISYSRLDSTWVDNLVRELEARGIDYWIDRRGIPFSVPWREEVEDAVQAGGLFLVCDSEHWRASAPCATEAAYAVQYGKVRLDISVGQDLGSAADQVGRALQHAVRRHGTATELSVKARDWSRHGRGGKGLAPLKLGRKFAALRKERDLSQVEQAYLVASRRRTQRQVAVSAALTLLLVVAYTSARVAPGVEKRVNEQLAEQAEQFMKTQAALSVIDRDPYQGLRLAAALGGNESAKDAAVLETALAVNLPDDAFSLSAEGRQFTDPTIDAQVRVTAKDGTVWARRADDRTRRSASHLPQAEAPSAAGAGAGDSTSPTVNVQWQPGSTRIQVLRHGKPWRTVVLGSSAHAARLSPDERWSAVATDTGVTLVDLTRGTVREVLRGAPAPLTDLAWTARGDRIWGLRGRSVFSWKVSDGEVVLDKPDEWFQDVLPAHDGAHLWVVSREGKLRLVARATGAVIRTLNVGGTVNSAAVNPSATDAAVAGAESNGMRIVDLTTGRTSPVRIPSGCASARPVYSRDGRSLYVPCLSGNVLVIDARTRQVTGEIDVPEPGVNALTLVPSGNQLLLGTGKGSVYSVALPPSSSPAFLYQVGCGPRIADIATAPGPWILPVGEGTGLAGCTQVARPKDDGSLRWDSLIDSPPDSVLALAAVFDPSGSAFAIGFSDGSVALHPSTNFLPRQMLPHIVGGVRSLLSLPTAGSGGRGGDLYVATRSGLVIRVPWCTSCLSNKAMVRTADQRLRRAQTIGLYSPSAPSPTPTPTVRKST